MTKCDQLDILGLLGAKEQESQPEQVTDSQVDEGPQLPTCPAPSHRDEGSRADLHRAPGGGGDRVFGHYVVSLRPTINQCNRAPTGHSLVNRGVHPGIWSKGSGATLPNPNPARTRGRSAMVCTPAGAAQSAGIVLTACMAVATLAARTCSARGSGRS